MAGKTIRDQRMPLWGYLLSPGGLLVLCLILIVGLIYVPRIIVSDEGAVTVATVLGSTAPGYLAERSWSVTFVGRTKTYQIMFDGSAVGPGDKFILQHRLNGEYTFGNL